MANAISQRQEEFSPLPLDAYSPPSKGRIGQANPSRQAEVPISQAAEMASLAGSITCRAAKCASSEPTQRETDNEVCWNCPIWALADQLASFSARAKAQMLWHMPSYHGASLGANHAVVPGAEAQSAAD